MVPMRNPVGPVLTSPLSVSWLNSIASLLPQVLPGEASLVRVLLKRNLDMVFPEKNLE
jgi:hypothetical protein